MISPKHHQANQFVGFDSCRNGHKYTKANTGIKPGSGYRYCKECAKECHDNASVSQKVKRQESKVIVFKHYGNCKCQCCGESDVRFLTIDHVNGGGSSHRLKLRKGGWNFCRWLIRNKFPTGYAILCFNCNCGRGANGGICPHKDVTESVGRELK